MLSETRPCTVCGGSTIRGLLIDRDEDHDNQACFAIEGDLSGYLAPSYAGQFPVLALACIDCGHIDHYVSHYRLRERLQQLGALDQEAQ